MKRRLFQKIFLSLIFFFPAVVEGQVLVDENFEKFTKGSEEVPDTKDISDPNTTQIDSSWTQQPGWTGAAVHHLSPVCSGMLLVISESAGSTIASVHTLEYFPHAVPNSVLLPL